MTAIPSRLRSVVLSLPDRFWFRPLIILICAIAVVLFGQALLPQSDTFNDLVGSWMKPDLARTVLSTLAGSTATVMALVFSMTFVAMSTVASQLGPRLLYEIDGDPVTQWIAGLFLSAFAVAIIGLLQPTVSGKEAGTQVVIALISAVLSFFSLVALVYYVHHLARQLTSDVVLQRRSEAFSTKLVEVFTLDHQAHHPPVCDLTNGNAILCNTSGYVDRIDLEQMQHWAEKEQLNIVVRVKPGQFLLMGDAMLSIEPSGVRNEVYEGIRDSLTITRERRFTDDIEKDLDSILEIMLRALSPGINDPYTAIAGIHQIGAALVSVIGKHRDDEWREGGHWSIYVRGTTIVDLIQKICRTLRSAIATQPIVTDEMIAMLEGLSARSDSAVKALVRQEVDNVVAASSAVVAIKEDRPEIV